MKKHIGIFAENLSRTVDRHMLVSLWASIRDADKIGRSFLQARTAMRYRFIISNPAIISVADIDAHIEKQCIPVCGAHTVGIEHEEMGNRR